MKKTESFEQLEPTIFNLWSNAVMAIVCILPLILFGDFKAQELPSFLLVFAVGAGAAAARLGDQFRLRRKIKKLRLKCEADPSYLHDASCQG